MEVHQGRNVLSHLSQIKTAGVPAEPGQADVIIDTGLWNFGGPPSFQRILDPIKVFQQVLAARIVEAYS
jgi:hypothetical protein